MSIQDTTLMTIAFATAMLLLGNALYGGAKLFLQATLSRLFMLQTKLNKAVFGLALYSGAIAILSAVAFPYVMKTVQPLLALKTSGFFVTLDL